MIMPNHRHKLIYETTREACAKRAFNNIVYYVDHTNCRSWFQFLILYDSIVGWENCYSDFRMLRMRLIRLRHDVYQQLVCNGYRLTQNKE